MCMFCRSLFDLLPLIFWPLCCLSFFDLHFGIFKLFLYIIVCPFALFHWLLPCLSYAIRLLVMSYKHDTENYRSSNTNPTKTQNTIRKTIDQVTRTPLKHKNTIRKTIDRVTRTQRKDKIYVKDCSEPDCYKDAISSFLSLNIIWFVFYD
jgi:hypothetical protein